MALTILPIKNFHITGTSEDFSEIHDYRKRLYSPIRQPFDMRPFEMLEYREDVQQFAIKITEQFLYIQTDINTKDKHVYIRQFVRTTPRRMLLFAIMFILEIGASDMVMII